MTPCKPSKRTPECAHCLRHRPDLPDDVKQRQRTLLIDASVVRAKRALCPLFANTRPA